jgi:putative DNA primase/helicase
VLAGRPGKRQMSAEIFEQFRAALEARNVIPPETIIADGEFHRCDVAGKHGKDDASYVLHLDGFPAGGFENWRDGHGWQPWRLNIGRPLTRAERDDLARREAATRIKRAEEAAQTQADARRRAARIWYAARAATPSHPYLAQKKVSGHDLREYKGALVVPLRAVDGTLHSLQFIAGDGSKRFLRGGRVAGMCYLLGTISEGRAVVCVAEGYATAATIHEATGYPAAAAFNAGNLAAVARTFRQTYPEASLIVCADDDFETPGNPGLALATNAARESGAAVAIPSFGAGRLSGETDFNDLHRKEGPDAVRTALDTALVPANESLLTVDVLAEGETDWTEPEPLGAPIDATPYPDHALPGVLGDAVRQAQSFVQAPMALVASSALSTLSVAVQSLVNVRRDHHLVGPVSLYLLALADSGERKTTSDAIFGAALRRWESERRQDLAHDIKKSEATLATFEAKKSGLLDAIKLKRRRSLDSTKEESSLEALLQEAPSPLAVPRLLYADATPEALAHALATGWPSAGVLSAEAGAVFGAHGMGQDNLMRNLALLNVLWDGGEMAIDRRTRPSFVLRGRRLTFGLMAQPEAFRSFLERAGTLPRGTGFIARFLIAWPLSTQGSRTYRPAPESMPAVMRFAERICTLLDTPLATDAHGGLTPVVLDLSQAARQAWIQIFNTIEHQLGRDGELHAVRDVAAKASENLVRLAALFHVMEHGVSGDIDIDCIQAANAVITWHISEARRVLAELDTPPALATAIRLDAWLCAEALANGTGRVPTRRVYQYGPNCVRDGREFTAALALLTERGRARLQVDGRQRYIAINPALLVDCE